MSCHCRNCVARSEEEKAEPVAWRLPTEYDLRLSRHLKAMSGAPLAFIEPPAVGLQRAQWGVLFRWSSLWVGAHWSPHNRRWCVNLLPCVTLWVALKGGKTP